MIKPKRHRKGLRKRKGLKKILLKRTKKSKIEKNNLGNSCKELITKEPDKRSKILALMILFSFRI